MTQIEQAAPPLVPDLRRGTMGAPPDALDPTGERAARRALRRQIAKLEGELCDAVTTSFPHPDIDLSCARSGGGPRLLALGELERARDGLAERVWHARRAVSARADAQETNRVLLERMLLEPGRHRFVRLADADVGGRGCGAWQVRPRLGLIGMLAGWWQVKLSSGCPLAEGSRGRAAPACLSC